MRQRTTTKLKTLVNTLTGEIKQTTLGHIAHNRVDFQKWESLAKDVREVQAMRFKASQQSHRLEVFSYAVYGG
jgi:hypothetical protein